MKRKHKLYSKPKKSFDKDRIMEEAEIVKKYGLKNKREIWKAEAKVKLIRNKAKSLIPASEEHKKVFIKRLNKMGFDVSTLADVLNLKKEDYLGRRLQSILVQKKLANTSKQARQMIVHKYVLVDGKAVNIPSYSVPVEFENKISLRERRIRKNTPKEIEMEQEGGSE